MIYYCERNFNCCDCHYWDSEKDVSNDAKECGHLVRAMPMVTAHWEDVAGSGFGNWRCSNCKEDFVFSLAKAYKYKRCPSCGAVMFDEL